MVSEVSAKSLPTLSLSGLWTAWGRWHHRMATEAQRPDVPWPTPKKQGLSGSVERTVAREPGARAWSLALMPRSRGAWGL